MVKTGLLVSPKRQKGNEDVAFGRNGCFFFIFVFLVYTYSCFKL